MRQIDVSWRKTNLHSNESLASSTHPGRATIIALDPGVLRTAPHRIAMHRILTGLQLTFKHSIYLLRKRELK